MITFEYRFESARDPGSFEARLNELGAEGWELVSADFEDGGFSQGILKRPRDDEESALIAVPAAFADEIRAWLRSGARGRPGSPE